VDFPGNPGAAPLAARTIVDCRNRPSGAELLLAFVQADPLRPVITGLIQTNTEVSPTPGSQDLRVTLDDERLLLRGDQEVRLECGQASVTLTRDGRVVIRGAQVVSQASGVNRIRGGSVQIN
jgi:hypothetical protein